MTISVDRLADIISEAWEQNRDVPFPLYREEAEGMARYLLERLPSKPEAGFNGSKAFPEADVSVTLTGYQWTALLGRIARPDALSELGRKTYNEAAGKLKEQLLAASERHLSQDFEDHVKAILDDVPPNLSREQFRSRYRQDLNAGHLREVEEAERRYFA